MTALVGGESPSPGSETRGVEGSPDVSALLAGPVDRRAWRGRSIRRSSSSPGPGAGSSLAVRHARRECGSPPVDTRPSSLTTSLRT